MSTVSKVLNGRGGVSDETRRRIKILLKHHGYQRIASDPPAPMIELVFSSMENEWAIEIIRGVERAAREQGMTVALTQSGDGHSPSPAWIDGVLRRRPVGVVLIFSDLGTDQKHQLRAARIPFVVVDPTSEPAADVPSIGSANWYGGMLATRHLIELGHERIAVITGPEDTIHSRARVAGFRSALEAAGLKVDERFIAAGQYRRIDGLQAGLELLRQIDPPTAIFAGADVQAVGVYQAARTLNMRIPDDVSIVGYDDLEVASWVAPGLTTVRQPLGEMAVEATRLVIRLAHDGPRENLHIDLATHLVVRGSTAPPAPLR